MTLQTERLCTIDQIRAFLNGNETVDYHPQDRAGAYEFVRRTLVRIGYDRLRRPDKGTVRKYLAKTTGLSRAQVTRLIAQYRETGQVADRRQRNSGRPFERVYTAADIHLLAEVDQIGNQMCGPATCAVMRRQFEVFGERRFERLAYLSSSHLYNLRSSGIYRAKRTLWHHTKPTTVQIGVRQRPEPGGRPGFVRVDTVHQGDRDGEKGIYVINLVDEVIQFEHIGAVAKITEAFLIPVLEELLVTLPFTILGFHADNGSEYINHQVAAMLNKLHIHLFTKSRARHSTDKSWVSYCNLLGLW